MARLLSRVLTLFFGASLVWFATAAIEDEEPDTTMASAATAPSCPAQMGRSPLASGLSGQIQTIGAERRLVCSYPTGQSATIVLHWYPSNPPAETTCALPETRSTQDVGAAGPSTVVLRYSQTKAAWFQINSQPNLVEALEQAGTVMLAAAEAEAAPCSRVAAGKYDCPAGVAGYTLNEFITVNGEVRLLNPTIPLSFALTCGYIARYTYSITVFWTEPGATAGGTRCGAVSDESRVYVLGKSAWMAVSGASNDQISYAQALAAAQPLLDNAAARAEPCLAVGGQAQPTAAAGQGAQPAATPGTAPRDEDGLATEPERPETFEEMYGDSLAGDVLEPNEPPTNGDAATAAVAVSGLRDGARDAAGDARPQGSAARPDPGASAGRAGASRRRPWRRHLA